MRRQGCARGAPPPWAAQGRTGSAPPLRWSAQPCPWRAFPALSPGRADAGKRSAAPNAAPGARARGAATLGGTGAHRVRAPAALVSPALSLPRLPCTGPGQGRRRQAKRRAQCGARGARAGRRHPGRHRVAQGPRPRCAGQPSPVPSAPSLQPGGQTQGSEVPRPMRLQGRARGAPPPWAAQGRTGSAPPLRWSAQPRPWRAFPALRPGRADAGKRNAGLNAAPGVRARGAATLGGTGSHRVAPPFMVSQHAMLLRHAIDPRRRSDLSVRRNSPVAVRRYTPVFGLHRTQWTTPSCFGVTGFTTQAVVLLLDEPGLQPLASGGALLPLGPQRVIDLTLGWLERAGLSEVSRSLPSRVLRRH